MITQDNKEAKNAVNLFIIDQSGSMEPLRNATQESYYGVIQKIKQEVAEFPLLNQFVNTWVFNNDQFIEKQVLTKIT